MPEDGCKTSHAFVVDMVFDILARGYDSNSEHYGANLGEVDMKTLLFF